MLLYFRPSRQVIKCSLISYGLSNLDAKQFSSLVAAVFDKSERLKSLDDCHTLTAFILTPPHPHTQHSFPHILSHPLTPTHTLTSQETVFLEE